MLGYAREDATQADALLCVHRKCWPRVIFQKKKKTNDRDTFGNRCLKHTHTSELNTKRVLRDRRISDRFERRARCVFACVCTRRVCVRVCVCACMYAPCEFLCIWHALSVWPRQLNEQRLSRSCVVCVCALLYVVISGSKAGPQRNHDNTIVGTQSYAIAIRNWRVSNVHLS